MPSLKELMEIAAAADTVDYATARKSLPITFLMEKYGHSVIVEGGRLKALCPFHEDSNPSFSIFGQDLEHWSCWGCSARGDAIDLLKRFEPDLVGADGKDSATVFRRVRELITEVIDVGWSGPEGARQQQPFDIQAATELVEASQIAPDYDRINEFVQFKRQQRGQAAWPFSAQYLIEEMRVGTYGSWVIIPYYNADNELIAYKRWVSPEKPRASVRGAGIWHGHLYGDWLPDNPELPILLCEGESDFWYAQYHVGDRYRVLGLATGVGTDTDRASTMAGRTVFLAFDGDGDENKGGRWGSQRWAKALEEAGANVRVVPVPEGKDLSTAGDINLLLAQARAYVMAPTGVYETATGYTKVDRKGNVMQLSNWVFQPRRGLRGTDSFAFEGMLKPGGDDAVIRASDLQTDAALGRWAAAHGRAWFGSTVDARMLLAIYQAADVFLPFGRMVTTAGLHDGTFVWPGGKIGPEPVVYVPPVADPHLDFRIHPGRWETDIVHTMRSVQRREVTDPILSWMAAAPLRPLYERFPFVAVTGAHGSGKTETIETLMRSFSGGWTQNTFRSSPHSITSVLAATNAIPIQLEEFRKGAREDSLKVGEQLFREAYTMQASQKGGLSENWAALTEIVPCAPFIVTGEDMLTEGSHVERAILLDMQAEFQNVEPFRLLRDAGSGGFAHAYLSWLQSKMADGSIPKRVDVKPAGPEDLGSRQRYNIGILHYGWGLLQAFMSEHNDNLGEPAFTHAITQLQEANKHTPIEDALRWCIGEPDAQWVCRLDPATKEVWVQVDGWYAYLTHSSRNGLYPLPGKAPMLRKYMLDRLKGRRETMNNREFVVIPYTKLVS